ncbi:MAG: hypothetical protein JWM61_2684 [Micrococcaceae bacterium]|nr:hypothetical protein [Micrococcaceae bacterium]
MVCRRSSFVAHLCQSRTFFCRSAKKYSIAALSPQAPTRPIDPVSPLFLSVCTKAFDRNCDPRSECRIVSTGPRSPIGVPDGGHGKSRGHPVIHRVADDALGVDVLDRAEVELAGVGPVFRDVREPQLVRPVGAELTGREFQNPAGHRDGDPVSGEVTDERVLHFGAAHGRRTPQPGAGSRSPA